MVLIAWPCHLTFFHVYCPPAACLQTTYLSFTCGPASGGATGTADGAAAAAAASALLSAIPCSKMPGALHNPGLAEAAQQVAAFQQMLSAWGTKVRGRGRPVVLHHGCITCQAGNQVCPLRLRSPVPAHSMPTMPTVPTTECALHPSAGLAAPPAPSPTPTVDSQMLHFCTSACRACRLMPWWSGSA